VIERRLVGSDIREVVESCYAGFYMSGKGVWDFIKIEIRVTGRFSTE
jgi:hypothetical protein